MSVLEDERPSSRGRRSHQERDILERAVGALTEQATKADALVDEALAAGSSGLRFSECAGLKVGALRLLERRLEVREVLVEAGGKLFTGRPKTKSSERDVYLSQPMADALAAHLLGYPSGPDGYVFTDDRGRPIMRTSFARHVLAPACDRAGLKGHSFHGLRHFAASEMARRSDNVKAVQTALGHASARTTLDIYAKVRNEDVAALADIVGLAVAPAFAIF